MQCAGGIAGTVVAHLMFYLAPLTIGIKGREGPSQLFAEAVATFTLVVVILGGLRYAAAAVPWLVGLTITAAYWFTSSTSFANPAVTLARGFTTTFAGIALGDVPGFILAQLIGAAIAVPVAMTLFPPAEGAAAALCRAGRRRRCRRGNKRDDIDSSICDVCRARDGQKGCGPQPRYRKIPRDKSSRGKSCGESIANGRFLGPRSD